MSAKTYDLDAVRIFECAAEGPALSNSQHAVDVIGEARANGATLVVIPAARLDPGSFKLRTGIAGDMVQKFVTYRVRLAIIGDFSELAFKSETLRDFIDEANRGDAIWFLAGLDELEKRVALAARGSS